jgi:hypothetical protein
MEHPTSETKPKGACSAYNLFFRDEMLVHGRALNRTKKGRGRNSSPGKVHAARLIADKWRCLPEGNKTGYVCRARQDKLRFSLELVKWKQRQEKEEKPERREETEIGSSKSATIHSAYFRKGSCGPMPNVRQNTDYFAPLDFPSEDPANQNGCQEPSLLDCGQGNLTDDPLLSNGRLDRLVALLGKEELDWLIRAFR